MLGVGHLDFAHTSGRSVLLNHQQQHSFNATCPYSRYLFFQVCGAFGINGDIDSSEPIVDVGSSPN